MQKIPFAKFYLNLQRDNCLIKQIYKQHYPENIYQLFCWSLQSFLLHRSIRLTTVAISCNSFQEVSLTPLMARTSVKSCARFYVSHQFMSSHPHLFLTCKTAEMLYPTPHDYGRLPWRGTRPHLHHVTAHLCRHVPEPQLPHLCLR